MKVAPGKMQEAMELNKEYMGMVARLLGKMPPMRMCRPLTGGGDYMHTVIFELEWGSLSAMAGFLEKLMADEEVQGLMPRWETLLESHEVELYTMME